MPRPDANLERLTCNDRYANERTLLPGSLAGLLEAAIKDAVQLSRIRYTPYSDDWHTTRGDAVCEVCLAGCLIARTLGNPPSKSLRPTMFSPNTRTKLEIVNFMRLGRWNCAFSKLYLDSPTEEIAFRIRKLPLPAYRNFCGWIEFLSHISSLRLAVEPLQTIDTLAREHGYRCYDDYFQPLSP